MLNNLQHQRQSRKLWILATAECISWEDVVAVVVENTVLAKVRSTGRLGRKRRLEGKGSRGRSLEGKRRKAPGCTTS